MYSILIVDDEPIIRRGIKTFIDFEKYNITNIYEADNGKTASSLFYEKLPDIVLLDINIPFKDGLTLANEMKSIKKDVKIALITGYDYFEYAQKAIKIGVEDYILKPVSQKDINNIILKLVESLNEDKKILNASQIIENWHTKQNVDINITNNRYKDMILSSIEKNYSDISFNLSSLSYDLNLSKSYLSILFKNIFGLNFNDYLNNFRMEKAKLLLLTTDLKNYEISDLIGIDNVNYFNLKFKKTFGVTPKEFKNNIINK